MLDSYFDSDPILRREIRGNEFKDQRMVAQVGKVKVASYPAHEIEDGETDSLGSNNAPLFIKIPLVPKNAIETLLDDMPEWLSEERKENLLMHTVMMSKLNPSWEEFFSEHYGNLEPERMKVLLKQYLRNVSHSSALREGSVQIGKHSIRVTPSIRRTAQLGEDRIAEGIYLQRFDSEHFSTKYPYPNFYPNCIAPHLLDSTVDTPIEWAKERVEIAHGYSLVYTGDTRAIEATQEPYERMAAIVCNSTPRELLDEREFELTSFACDLLIEACNSTGKDLTAEETIFLLENQHYFNLEAGIPKEVLELFEILPLALENGLVIDRVSQLTRESVESGLSTSDALLHASKIVKAIYCSGEVSQKPWWFKEDFSLSANHSLSKETANELELLAQKSRYSYQYTRDTWLKVRDSLVESAGISIEQAIDLTVFTVERFGIGNSERAVRVLGFAVSALAEVGAEQKKPTLEQIQSTLDLRKPRNILIGILEGPDANFRKPGMYTLLSGLGHPEAQREGIHEVNIELSHLYSIGERLSIPLHERASLPPAIRDGLTPRYLLQGKDNSNNLLSAPSQSERGLARVNNPVSSWFSFEAQLNTECQHETQMIAGLYFTFFANKFPDPFSPPAGFLKFLSEFRSIPDPNFTYDIMVAPWKREQVQHENAQSAVNRYSVLSGLVDSWLIGLIDWEDLENVFEWVTPSELPETVSKKIEVEELWDNYWSSCEGHLGSMAELAADYHTEYRDLQAELIKDTYLYKGQVDPHLLGKANEAKQFWEMEEEGLHEALLRRDKVIDEEYLTFNSKDTIIGRTRTDRLEKLEGGLRGIVALNALAGGKILDKVEVTARFKHFLSLIAGETDREEVSEYEALEFREHLFPIKDEEESAVPLLDLATFQELGALGVFDIEALSSILNSCTSIDDYSTLATRLEGVSAKLKDARDDIVKLAAHSESTKKLVTSALMVGNAKLRTRRTFWRNVDEKLGDDSIISEQARQLLVKEYYWPDRHAQIMQRVGRFRRHTLPGALNTACTLETDENRQIEQVNESILTTAYYLGTAQVYDHVENPLLLKIAPDKDSEELTSPVPAIADKSQKEKREVVARSYAKVDQEIPSIVDSIIAQRKKAFGLLPVGGKIHVTGSISPERFELLRKGLGISSTAFRLLHANDSMLLPPAPSAGELKLIIRLLDAEKIIDWDSPQLHITGAGRLGAYDCAILGASILLGTEEGIEYSPDAFYTGGINDGGRFDNDTGCRMVTYDAGGPRAKFPFDTDLNGRTDIMGKTSSR